MPSASDTTVHGNQRTNPVGGSSAAKLGNNVGSAVNKGENVSEPDVWEQSHDENAGAGADARPAQVTATTTDEGLVQTHEGTSLQAGEKGDELNVASQGQEG